MLNVPNILTLLRLALIPVVAYFLIAGAYAIALPMFLVAALTISLTATSRADSGSQRAWAQRSHPDRGQAEHAGSRPSCSAWQGLLPLWLAMAIIGRDIPSSPAH